MKAARTRFALSFGALFIGSALALVSATAAGAPADPSRGTGGPGAQLASRDRTGGGSSELKHISTTVTTFEIWLPFLGWTVVCEATSVECGPGGRNCPTRPQA